MALGSDNLSAGSAVKSNCGTARENAREKKGGGGNRMIKGTRLQPAGIHSSLTPTAHNKGGARAPEKQHPSV